MTGSQAVRPGSHRLAIVATLVVAAIAASVAVVLLTGGGSAPADTKYGGIPSWLPKATIPVGRVLTASAAHPALTIQGDTVAVNLAAGRVTATAVGPQVPEEGHFPIPRTSPCTFVVTFTAAHGAVPLARRAFIFVDEEGHPHWPRSVTVMGGAPLPNVVAPGRTVNVVVNAVLPTGGGRLLWSPVGLHPIVAWDYSVEID